MGAKEASVKKTRAGNKPSRFGRHPQAGYHIQASVWIEKDGELYLGGGRVMLLEYIAKLGSIAAAARSMHLTYNNAWLWINAMNKLAPSPLVERMAGGAGGGYAKLTEEGLRAIAQFHELRARLEEFAVTAPSREDLGGEESGHFSRQSKRPQATNNPLS
ncbi:MAG: LysR family transcriptional regulator [Dehalococcoidia bacterium]|nr:LysR family transcriptional regulator [Dehalococcoidia bacterium]